MAVRVFSARGPCTLLQGRSYRRLAGKMRQQFDVSRGTFRRAAINGGLKFARDEANQLQPLRFAAIGSAKIRHAHGLCGKVADQRGVFFRPCIQQSRRASLRNDCGIVHQGVPPLFISAVIAANILFFIWRPDTRREI